MRRKLVKQGINALTITVPSYWVKKNHLQSGDELSVFDSENILQLSTEKTKPPRTMIVDVSGLHPKIAVRLLSRAYRKGYDRVTVKFDKPSLMHAIQNKVPQLLGFEILSIEKNQLHIQVIAEDLNLDFDVMLRRSFFVLLDMMRTCHDSWEKEENELLSNMSYQDIDVNKFTYFCLRTLNKSRRQMSFDTSTLYYLIESLEDLGDELKSIGKYLSETKPDKKVLPVLKDMSLAFKKTYEIFYKPKKNEIVRQYDRIGEIYEQIDRILSKRNDIKLTSALRAMYHATHIISSIAMMRLDMLKETESR